ncbi:MAG: alpha/beta hydrolase [Nostocoides sp.]
MQPRVVGILAVLLLAVGAGCGSSPREQGAPGPPTPSAAASTTTTKAPYVTPPGPLERCGPQPVVVARTDFHYRVTHDPRGGKVPMVTAGHGSTVAVLLHQTDGNGLCGWLPFAAKIVEDPSLAIIATDLCGYGDANCPDGAGSTDAASLAIDIARRDLHARRIVLVGASMGGSIALITAVSHGQVDAAADLSGPIEWPGMTLVRGGRALHVPVLVAMADTESAADVRGARDIVAHAPKGSTFLEPSAGHGYDLLLDPNGAPGPVAAPLLAWITGKPPRP